MSEGAPSGLADSSTAAPKKRKLASSGRKESPCWDNFEKTALPEERAKSLGRNFDGECLAGGAIVTGKPKDLNRHLSECKELAPGDQVTALMAAAAQAGVNAETGHATGSAASNSTAPKKKSTSPMKKYLDRATVEPAEMQRLQIVCCLANNGYDRDIRPSCFMTASEASVISMHFAATPVRFDQGEGISAGFRFRPVVK